MKEQKFLIVNNERPVNEWLDRGWEIISVTPQKVSVTGDNWNEIKGEFAVVIQKQS